MRNLPSLSLAYECPVELARDLPLKGGGRTEHSVGRKQKATMLRSRLGADDKVQEVILRAMAKKAVWWQAAEKTGNGWRSPP